MDGYLLDTNHLIPLLNPNDAGRAKIMARLAALAPGSHLSIAASTLAELEVGCALGGTDREQAQKEIRQVISTNGLDVRPFTHHTAAEYGAIKAQLIEKYNRKTVKKGSKWPESWPDSATGHSLGIDELDLFAISHAIERNVILVTRDPMRRILDVVNAVKEVLRVESWL